MAIRRKARSLDDVLGAYATVSAETIAMASVTDQNAQSMVATLKSYLDSAVSFHPGNGK